MKISVLVVLGLSIALNALLAGGWLLRELEGCAEIPDGRLGVLARDVEVGRFNEAERLFVLPKGLVVREASATGMDWFEPYRFRLVITSEDAGLVAYPAEEARNGEYYSAAATRGRRTQIREELRKRAGGRGDAGRVAEG
jgi:hypothetical protein